MLTIDEQLDQALAKVKSLEGDAQAGANLLTEAAATNTRLTTQVAELEAQRERLDADLLTARQTIGSLTQQKGEIETRLGEITARNTALEAAEQDIEKRASKRAAEILAATGTQAPAPVTPKGDHQADDLLVRFKAINDPGEQTIFWRSLTPAQQAQILAATTTSETR
jgi:DNA repair exonuclease SbcCD ATPase subunit